MNAEPGLSVCLEVSDNGCGIMPDELDHIFEPFFSRGKKGKSGTGLGLAVVYGVVQDFNGAIDVASQPGQGTRFTLNFPAPYPVEPVAVAAPAPEKAIRRVLVVDDEPVQRELCRMLLASKGCDIALAGSGREAVEFLRHHDVDLVLLDMIMEADFDGLKTFETIRTFKPAQRCLIVSGYAESENVRKALDLGVRGFVQKPFTLRVLYEAMQRAVV